VGGGFCTHNFSSVLCKLAHPGFQNRIIVDACHCAQLWVGANRLEDAGACALADALTSANCTLQTLIANHDPSIGDASAAAFAKVLTKNCAMTKVLLAAVPGEKLAFAAVCLP